MVTYTREILIPLKKMAVLILKEFMKLMNGEISNRIFQMLDADDAVLLLISSNGNIITQTSGAERLLQQAPLRPVCEVLSGRAAKAVRFVLETGGESTLDEEIDGHLYRLDIRPVSEGALLYFAPTEDRVPVMPLPLYGQIVNSLSHILALLYLIPGADEARQKHLLDDVHRNSLRIYRGLSHLHLLEYAGEPAQILHLRAHNLSALCRKLGHTCADAAKERGISVTVSVDVPESCSAVYDEALMTRAVLELLVNAVRTRGAAHVTLALRPAAGRVSIIVSNDGCALPPEELDRLYSGWRRAQDSMTLLEQHAAGLPYGLGLPLVRRIAGWHGGALLLESSSENSTVFRLSFPDHLPADATSFGQTVLEDSLDLTELELSIL